MMTGCQLFQRKHQVGAVVELNGQYLYRTTLDSLSIGLSPEDSTRVVQQYIGQWAKDILMYDNAVSRQKSKLKSQKSRAVSREIEQLVDDYRRTLYVHAYEEYLVDRRMPKSVADSVVEEMYARMPERFRLDESIVKGLLFVMPQKAPNMKKLREWLSNTDAHMDEIEKYAYQYGSGYELFTDQWKTTSELLVHIPVERSELESQLRQSRQIEINDSTKTYLLQVTERHLRGEAMPLEYARPEIEKMVLNARQVDFLQRERERLYEEAIQDKEIIFYN